MKGHIVKLAFIIATALIVGINCYAGGWSLDDCLKYAEEHNLELQQRSVEIEKQKWQLKKSKNSWIPNLTAGLDGVVGYGNVSTANGNISIGDNRKYGFTYVPFIIESTMSLYAGGGIKNQIQSDKQLLSAAEMDYNSALKDIYTKVAVQYLQTLYYKGMVKVSERQCELSRKFFEKSDHLVQDGRQPESERAEAMSKLALDEYNLEQDKGNYMLALVRLAQLLTIDDVENFDIEDASLQNSDIADMSLMPDKDYYESSVNNYPTVLAAEAKASAAENQIKVAKSDMIPHINLKGALKTSYYYVFDKAVSAPDFYDQVFKNNHAEMIGVMINIPIFNRYATKSAVNKAKLDKKSKDIAIEQTKQDLRNEIQQAYFNASVAANKYKSAVKAKEAAEISFNYAVEKYSSGRSTVYDFNESNQKWIKSQQDELQCKYEFLIRKQILDFYISNN